MIIIKRFFVIGAVLLAHQYAHAATYYIDSTIGNDSWSGNLPTPTGSPASDGPWQSLSRLADASLSPGDVVELQCGSKWAQTLKLKNSGTPDSPIIIRAASSACEVPPSVDGSQSIDAHSWVPHNDAIYKASWPPQKLENGSVASGIAGWNSWSASEDEKLIHETTCPDSSSGCAGFTSSVKSGGSIAISNRFSVEAGIAYRGGLSLRVPVGIKVKVLVRRGSSPYEPISAVQWITGTDAWQKVSFAFIPGFSVANARLDMEVFSPGVKFHFKNASLTPAFAAPVGAWIDDLPLLPAYHPNRGHNTTRPNSVYARVAENGNTVRYYGNIGSSYLDIDSTLQLPQGVTPRPGNRLRIRTAPWHVDEVTVTKVENNRLHFEPITRYEVKTGQGYFVLGELGMLDSPGEWFYDASTGSTYTWMPDSIAPSDRIRLSVLEKGVDLSNRSNIIIEGIHIRYTDLGVDLTKAQNISLNSVNIVNTVRQGILANLGKNISIIASRLYRTGGDAISASNTSTLSVKNNDITESAVAFDADRVWSLPGTTYAAIFAGQYANVTGNRIKFSAGIGIWVRADGIISNGIIESNAISHSCLTINDCGGIYVNYASPTNRIASNLIERVSGNIDGLSSDDVALGVGIYLDQNSANNTIENNTVAWADYGMLLHDVFNNHFSGNTFFGNRQYQILMQEETRNVRAEGDLHNNQLDGNILVPLKPTISLLKKSSVGLTDAFATFERNHYSALLSSRIVGDRPANGPHVELRFEEWQATPVIAGNAPDRTERATYPIGYAASRSAGDNIVPNGKLTAGRTGWSSWNLTPPLGQLKLENCAPVGPCLHYSAGASKGLITSPNFSITANAWYRASFDARTEEAEQPFSVLVRRDGWGTDVGYESLMGKPEAFFGQPEWKRYSFSFKATKSIIVNDPSTGERGARFDVEQIPVGKTLYIANLEIVPSTALETGLNLHLLSNTGRDAIDIPCPDEERAPAGCANYIRFSDQTPVSWPLNLLPLESEIVFTRDAALVDSDADGVADVEDRCHETPARQVTDAAGCALTQIPG